jgi:hypothetical protein
VGLGATGGNAAVAIARGEEAGSDDGRDSRGDENDQEEHVFITVHSNL